MPGVPGQCTAKRRRKCARQTGILNKDFTANIPGNLPLKKIQNRLRFDRIMVMSLWPHFFGSSCIYYYVHEY